MTLRALGGLLVFNLFIVGVGAGVLWGVRGWRWWTDFVRVIGVAYLLGLSALTIIMMLELVLGIPVGPVTMALSGAGLVAAGVLIGRRRGLTAPGLRPPGWHFPGISVFVALFVAGIVVYFEALFRADRLAGVAREWDSWANWVPKSKSLYVSGRLDIEFMTLVPQLPSYPPGPFTLQAGAFHAMGSADTATLHVQYWFFAVGFAVAVIGLLADRVHNAILFPVLLGLLVAPSLVEWITTVYADIPLGYLIALAALLLVLWIEERESWQLAAATILLAGAMLTKREGLLFAACVLLAAFAASFAERRQLWPRLLAAGLTAVVLVLPWRIWFMTRGLPADGPDTGFVGDSASLDDRLWPALEVSVRTLFHQDLWHLTPVVAVVAIGLAALAGGWRVSLYTGVFLVAAVAGATWVVWTNIGIALTHDDWAIRRLTGTTFLVLAVLTPLLLQRAWSSEPGSRVSVEATGPDALFRPSKLAWVIVLFGLLSHPGSMLVGYSGSGLPGGLPIFPGTAGCAAPPVADASVRVVLGYADSHLQASALRKRARAAGLPDVAVGQDGCGRLRVYVDDVPTMSVAQALLADARASRLTATVERDSDD